MEEGHAGDYASDAELRRLAPGEEMAPDVSSPDALMVNMINREQNAGMVGACAGHESVVRDQERGLERVEPKVCVFFSLFFLGCIHCSDRAYT
jgi:hypothetical protein